MFRRIVNDRLFTHHKKYLFWNGANNFLGGIKYTLSTDSLLSVMNVESPFLTGRISYISKDLVGQMGCFEYAYRQNNTSNDKEPVKTGKRLNATVQGCVFLENVTPFLPSSMYIPVAGVSNIIKNVCMVGSGSINAKIIREIAKENNDIAEIYTKISAHNSVSSSLGMMTGLLLIHFIPSRVVRFWVICPLISFLHYKTYCITLKHIF